MEQINLSIFYSVSQIKYYFFKKKSQKVCMEEVSYSVLWNLKIVSQSFRRKDISPSGRWAAKHCNLLQVTSWKPSAKSIFFLAQII